MKRQILIGYQNPCYGSNPGTTIEKIVVTETPEKEESYWPSRGPIHYVDENMIYITPDMWGYIPYERRTKNALKEQEEKILSHYNKEWDASYKYVRFEDFL